MAFRADLERARRLVPKLEAIFSQMDSLRQEVIARANELERMGYSASMRIRPDGDPPEISDRRAFLETKKNALRDCPKQFEALGAVLLDLDLGLIGFRTELEGVPVYLSWQRGERDVGHYQPLDGEFRDRKRINPD